MSEGHAEAREALYPLVYGELRDAAARAMRRERADHTLQPTALVNEAWLKLSAGAGVEWRDRNHFVGIAARAMRQVLVDHARSRQAEKRGGDRERVVLDEASSPFESPDLDLVALDEALERLAENDAELGRMVELRFFAGLTVPETAEVMGVSHRRVERGWAVARSWLHGELTRAADRD
jgi:RNA polymerase sigma factor (TIGR02999 family)